MPASVAGRPGRLRSAGGRVLFETALKTGMRLGELSALTWGDVDLV
jgi:integrase